jgi:hypothetical protein
MPTRLTNFGWTSDPTRRNRRLEVYADLATDRAGWEPQ